LTSRNDINLDIAFRVAWQGEAVCFSESALRRIADCRAAFMRLIDADPNLVIYGVTTAMGELASRRLEPGERVRHARLKPFAAATSFGHPLPERVVRGIVFARLANFVEGNAATTPRIAEAVAAMLDGGLPPAVPGSGQGGAGEILALYPLFADLSRRFDLDVKERGSLINGSPCAAAMAADAALAACRRVRRAEQVFALSIEAFRAPLEHYDAALEALWGDEHEAAALRGLREFLIGAGDGRRNYQAPVSYRIVPGSWTMPIARWRRPSTPPPFPSARSPTTLSTSRRMRRIPWGAASAPAGITMPWRRPPWTISRRSGRTSACFATATVRSCSTAGRPTCRTC
jgi:histidine ammonia-lyase